MIKKKLSVLVHAKMVKIVDHLVCFSFFRMASDCTLFSSNISLSMYGLSAWRVFRTESLPRAFGGCISVVYTIRPLWFSCVMSGSWPCAAP